MSETFAYSQEEFWMGEPIWYPQASRINQVPEVAANGEFIIGGLPERLGSASNELFLSDEVFADARLGEFLLRRLDFKAKPEWSVGREDSTHQVFFGELTLTPDVGRIDSVNSETTMPVAVKPYHTARKLAVGEFAAYTHVREEGFIPTLTPIGFWVDENGRTNMLSNFEPEVVSLDNVDWRKDGEDPLKQHFSLFQALQRSAFILARLHGRGYVHGDAQIKNMALSNTGVKLIDLERMVRVADSADSGIEKLGERIRTDLDMLVESVVQRGYLYSDSQRARREMIDMAVLAPHGSQLRHPSTPIGSTVLVKILEDAQEDILAKL